ncbi:MAG: glycosyl transferase, partial [Gemmatimonadota bacterium]|nr:glycosyl transferase [Gemmatimonadota bacterium]
MNDRTAASAQEHELANDRYHLTIADDGTGSSHYGALAITRRVPNRTRETDAFVLYIRDLETGDFWSAGAEPVRCAGDAYEAIAHDGIVTLIREHDGIRTTMEITLAPNAPVEERRLTIENLSGRERRLDVTTYAELVLNTPVADTAHPAFSKLFVQTEWSEAQQALLAMRRLRAVDDEPLWVIHTLRSVGGATGLSYETDRMRFIGRGRTTARPRLLDAGAELSGTTGAVLDPILSLRTSVTLAAGATAEMVALLGAGHTRDEVLAIVAERGTPTARVRASGVKKSAGLSEARVVLTDRYRPARAPKTTMVANPEEELRFFNGFGGFSTDGTEYVIRLDATPSGLRWPPMPWSNVIANENAGCIVTGAGAVTSWSANSRENRLTPWFNDPVSDPFGEAIYLRDDDSGVFWSPLPGPTPAPAPYEARHGFGYSTWRHTSHELEQTTTTWFPRHDPVKIVRLKLRSTSIRSRTITVTSYAHLVLGGVAWATAPSIVTALDGETGAILATNPSRGEFSKRAAFAALVAPAGASKVSATGDRTAFLGRTGSVSDPAALHIDGPLDGHVGAGLDPCAAFRTTLTIPPGSTVEILFLLGEAESEARALSLLKTHQSFAATNKSLDTAREFWRDTLGGVQIETPSPVLDLMVNGWLAYQNLACRVWGRSAYYQSGGAFGFRDQLQDSAALLYLEPSLTRSQILLHSAHQFVEGDVMHWWHPPTSKGIRTRFSDDLLWLPYITAFYIASTGDASVLD